MPLQTFRAKLPLGLGIDTKTDSKSLPPTKLELLENGTFVERGSIVTRNGYDVLNDELDDGTVLPAGTKCLFTRGHEVGVITDTKLYSYATGPQKWIDRGAMLLPQVTLKTAANSTSEQSRVDTAASNGIRVFAWEDATGGIRVTVQDTESDTVHVSDYQISTTGVRPRCIAMGGFCFVYYVEASSNSLYVVRISPTSPRTSAQETPALVAADIEDNPVAYALVPYSTYGVLAYRDTSGNTAVCYLWINGQVGSPGQGNLASPYTDSDLWEATVVDICVSPEGEIGVVAGNGSSILARVFNSSLQPATGDSDFMTIAAAGTISALTVCCEPTTRSGLYHYQVIAQITGASNWLYYTQQARFYRDGGNYSTAASVVYYRHTGIAGKAFATDDYVYVPLVHDSPDQPTYFIARVDPKLLVGRFLDGGGGGLTTNWSPSSVYRDGDVFSWATVFRNQLPVETGSAASYSDKSIKLVMLDFDPDHYGAWSTLGGSTYFAGAQTWMYDGASPVEQGFALYPENITAAASTTASGALTTTSTIEYACFWEWYNDAGEREISTYAGGVSVTLSGTQNTVTLTVPTLSLTNKYTPNRSGIRLMVTRTKANQTTRFRADNPASPVWNNPSVDTITFLDVLSDTSLGSRELDYTNVELDHVPAPACKVIAAGQDRIFVSGLEDPNLVKASKTHKFGMAASFHDDLQILTDQAGGKVTALTVLDDKLIIFKEDRIFVTDSLGPSNLNTGDPWATPQLVTTDLGCIESRSVVQTPEGVMFQSKKGIWLLNRSLSVEYIGADVELYNDQTITAANTLQDSYQVRFLSDTGTTLMYDYYFRQWSTFTNHQGKSAVVWDDTYTYLRNSGAVWTETPDEYLDGTQGIRLKIRTGWLNWDGMQGETRVYKMWLLGKFHSEHIIYQRVGKNYEGAWVDTQPWNPADAINTTVWGDGDWGSGVWGGANETRYQYRANLPFQRCEAIRFEWELIPSQDNPGKGATINQVELEIGIEHRGFFMGSNRTIS